jgi:PTS system nitrogen regulatory IIA component
MMDIAELIGPDQIVIGLEIADKPGLLSELSKRASRVTGIAAESILQALLKREGFGSTGIGRGLAIPHAPVEGLKRAVGILVRLKRPIAFDAVDGEPVDVVFLLLTPNGNNAALAAISRRLRDGLVVKTLRNGASAEDVYNRLVGLV